MIQVMGIFMGRTGGKSGGHPNKKKNIGLACLEDNVDEDLKNGRGIGETKRHDKVFIMAMGGIDCSPPLIRLSDPNKVVCNAETRLLENGGILVQKLNRSVAINMGSFIPLKSLQGCRAPSDR